MGAGLFLGNRVPGYQKVEEEPAQEGKEQKSPPPPV